MMASLCARVSIGLTGTNRVVTVVTNICRVLRTHREYIFEP